MRTFETFEKIKDALTGERKYQVTASITVVFRRGMNPSEFNTLREMIKEIDRQFPWRDDTDRDSDDSLGLYEISRGEELENEDKAGDPACWFSITPKHSWMRRNQVYAYERYLAKIAQELTKKLLHRTREIISSIHVSGATRFRYE